MAKDDTSKLQKSVDLVAETTAHILVVLEDMATKQDLAALDQKVVALDKKVDTLDQSIQSTRQDILKMGDRFVSRHEFDNHLVRFNNLEKEVKAKS